MKRLALVLALCAIASAANAQFTQEATWSGTLRRMDGQANQNRPTQKFTIEVKKIPDPHWAWRPQGGEVWTTVYTGPPIGKSPVIGPVLEQGTLTFSLIRTDVRVACRLTQQPDDTFQGTCFGEDSQNFHMVLSPPAAATKK